jgi:ribose transport system permease protein
MPPDSAPAGSVTSLAPIGGESARPAWSSGRLADVRHYKGLTALLILVALFAILAFAEPNFLSERALTIIARQISFVGIAGLGAVLVFSTGQLDLSVGSCMGLAGVIAAYCTVYLGMPSAAALACALGAGAIYGTINGALVVGLNLNSLIVTLATGLMGRGTIYALTGATPVGGFSPELRLLGVGYVLGMPIPVWIVLALTAAFSLVMARTTFGWHIYAIGGNEEAARLSGIRVDRLKLVAFVVAGTMSALGGVLLTAKLGSGEVNIGIGYELDLIAAAVIGGLRFGAGSSGVTPFAMLLGVAVMSVMRSALSLLDVASAFQPIVLGGAILFAMGLERVRSFRQK